MAWSPELEIVYNRAQTLWYMATEGQPKNAAPVPTLTVYRNDGSSVFVATKTATAEQTDISLASESGASQANRALLHLSGATGLIADQVYQLYETGKPTQDVVIRELVSVGGGAYDAYLTTALDVTFTAAAKLQSRWVYCALTAAEVDDETLLEDGMVARWAYTVGTTAYTNDVRYNHVLQDTLTSPLTVADLMSINPDLFQQSTFAGTGTQLKTMMSVAWRQIRQELRGARVDLQRVLNLNVFDYVIYHDVVCRLAGEGRFRLRSMTPEEFRRYHERKRTQAMQTALGAVQYSSSSTDPNKPYSDTRGLPHRIWRT